jgi:hypothetical protein
MTLSLRPPQTADELQNCRMLRQHAVIDPPGVRRLEGCGGVASRTRP